MKDEEISQGPEGGHRHGGAGAPPLAWRRVWKRPWGAGNSSTGIRGSWTVQGEAHLIALACGEPPEGRAGWTLQLLADQLVECEIVDSISTETVRQTLKKTNSNPG